MARNGGAKKIAVNGVYLISVLRLKHFDLISDALPFGRLWYGEPNAISNAIGYATFRSRSRDAVICVYDDAGNVIETHEQAGEFKNLESVPQFVPDVSRIPFLMLQGAPEAQLQMRKIVLDLNPRFSLRSI